MKCPVCGREYRAGAQRCRKCEVLLVESAQSATESGKAAAPGSGSKSGGNQNQRAPLLLWSGQDPVLFSALTHELAGAAIPFYESAVHDPAGGLFASFPLRSEAVGGFEIRVAGCDLTAAQEILQSIVGTIGTIGDDSDKSAAEDDVVTGEKHGGASRSALDWLAVDATAELWNGDDEAWAAYLVDVLWENGVRARTIQDSPAYSRILVRPADYPRAQRVLRVLEEASSSE
ncbi:MAG: hypothetical protein WBE97_12065 [Candidatus Acidiferrales bacterium]